MAAFRGMTCPSRVPPKLCWATHESFNQKPRLPGDAVTLWTLKLDDNDLGLTRLRDVYRELRKAIGGAQAARRLTSAGA